MDDNMLNPQAAAEEQETNPLAGLSIEDQIAARLVEIEALKLKIANLRNEMKQPDNSHLEEMTADEVLALMPDDLHVAIMQGDKILTKQPIKFVAKKKVTSVIKSRMTFSPMAGGTTVVPITARYQAGFIVPFGKKEQKEKKAKKSKKESK